MLLLQSPFFLALLLVACGVLIGCAVSIGREQVQLNQEPSVSTTIEVDTWREKLAAAQQELEIVPELQSRIRALEKECQQRPTAEMVDALQREYRRAQDSVRQAQNAEIAVAEERDEVVQALEAARQQIARLQADLASHQRAVGTIERYRTNAQATLVNAQQRIEDLVRERDALASQADAMREELQELRQHDVTRHVHLATVQDTERRAQLEHRTAIAEVHHLRSCMDSLQAQVLTQQRNEERLRSDRESLISSLRAAHEQIETLMSQVRCLEVERDQVSQERDALRLQKSEWQQPPTPAVSISSAEAESRVAELQGLVDMLREQLRMAQIQAQETVQRQLESAVTSGLSSLRSSVAVPAPHNPTTVSDVPREELIQRIRAQSQLLAQRDEAA